MYTDIMHIDITYTDIMHIDITCTDIMHIDITYTDIMHIDITYTDSVQKKNTNQGSSTCPLYTSTTKTPIMPSIHQYYQNMPSIHQ
ncbi:hypothetical protein BgiBS90_011139 [Biomphalaria glabrata]|nr:hypothetical protein BgiBS90_011139 [Biomphalaria glabrata]